MKRSRLHAVWVDDGLDSELILRLVFLFPLLVCLVDPRLHLLERLLQHLREVLRHRIDLVRQLLDLCVFCLNGRRRFIVHVRFLLLESRDFDLVIVNRLRQLRLLMGQLVFSGLVLAHHISYDVLMTFDFFLFHLFQLLVSITIFLLCLLLFICQ